ncbi:granzyme B-like [Mugil cephalus]|uniref:granzyme B-like n=1 Tax=Mugil cephalus TaxID=48193 RepID=UPI001FB68F8D|nr:granzyme B-like [Mugil cephalus]
MIHACCILYVLLMVTLAGASESGIVGGKVTKPHSRPYMASLQYQGKHSCGGILIREDFVLTAAHCQDSQTMTVVLGAHDVTKKEKSQQHIKVAKYYPYQKFDGTIDYDIMLLKLENNATLNKYVKTIGLPKKNGKIPAKIKCVVAGWGKTGPNESASPVLKEATETIQFPSECNKIWQKYFTSARMICTTFGKKGGVCQGDSGGPILCNNKVQGLTAFTRINECDNPKYPHVFTKVNFYSAWINETMKN